MLISCPAKSAWGTQLLYLGTCVAGKVISASEAAQLIPSNAVITVSGFVGSGASPFSVLHPVVCTHRVHWLTVVPWQGTRSSW